jgi:Pectate lyase superfamily protein
MSNTFSRDPEPLVQYGGDGSRTTFPFPFPVLAVDDLLVYIGQNPATGFSITGIGDPDGGEVVFATAPAAGTTLTLLRRTEGTRETEFVDGGPFRASAINAELDRIMLLIQEDREEHGRALRGHPAEVGIDFCLPPTTERANRLLGFDSAGRPAVFGASALPSSGDASGALVTASGATTARSLGEHTAALVNVRDFGALGDGVTDDSAAFAAAITAAQGRGARVYVPASATPYAIGATIALDGLTMTGDGAGSVLRVGLPSGAGITLAGSGAGLIGLRVLGPGAAAWPGSPADVDLGAVALDGVRIASGAEDATIQAVEVAACATALAIEGGVQAIVGCDFSHSFRGIEIRSGAAGAIFVTRTRLHACTRGIHTDGAAAFDQLALRGGAVSACGHGLDLPAPASAWRTLEMSDLAFSKNLEADLEAGPRQSLALRGSRLDGSGKRNGAAIELNAGGETTEAPNLVVENSSAEHAAVVSVELSGGSNLNLLAAGDLIVLAADLDDVDDLWTALKATRGGVVHKVTAQTAGTATIELASAGALPVLAAADIIRVVGRSGTATVDSVSAGMPASDFVWLRADDHCRVFAANNPMPADQIELEGPDADLRHFPGLDDAPVAISGVELQRQAINGALVQLLTFEIAQDAAVSFVPQSPIGLVHVFSHGAAGDPAASVLSYRADGLGYTQIVAKSTYAVPSVNPAMSDVEVKQLTALTGTTGAPNVFTFSAHSDGRIYVENRKAGAPRTVSLFVVGAPL